MFSPPLTLLQVALDEPEAFCAELVATVREFRAPAVERMLRLQAGVGVEDVPIGTEEAAGSLSGAALRNVSLKGAKAA
jgi:hypothetical protein